MQLAIILPPRRSHARKEQEMTREQKQRHVRQWRRRSPQLAAVLSANIIGTNDSPAIEWLPRRTHRAEAMAQRAKEGRR
jgi:hypothetical protein